MGDVALFFFFEEEKNSMDEDGEIERKVKELIGSVSEEKDQCETGFQNSNIKHKLCKEENSCTQKVYKDLGQIWEDVCRDPHRCFGEEFVKDQISKRVSDTESEYTQGMQNIFWFISTLEDKTEKKSMTHKVIKYYKEMWNDVPIQLQEWYGFTSTPETTTDVKYADAISLLITFVTNQFCLPSFIVCYPPEYDSSKDILLTRVFFSILTEEYKCEDCVSLCIRFIDAILSHYKEIQAVIPEEKIQEEILVKIQAGIQEPMDFITSLRIVRGIMQTRTGDLVSSCEFTYDGLTYEQLDILEYVYESNTTEQARAGVQGLINKGVAMLRSVGNSTHLCTNDSFPKFPLQLSKIHVPGGYFNAKTLVQCRDLELNVLKGIALKQASGTKKKNVFCKLRYFIFYKEDEKTTRCMYFNREPDVSHVTLHMFELTGINSAHDGKSLILTGQDLQDYKLETRDDVTKLESTTTLTTGIRNIKQFVNYHTIGQNDDTYIRIYPGSQQCVQSWVQALENLICFRDVGGKIKENDILKACNPARLQSENDRVDCEKRHKRHPLPPYWET